MACLGKRLVLRTVFFKKKIKNIELKMGGTPFGRQDFSVLSLSSPLVLSPLFSSLVRLSLVSRVLSLVSRSLARLSLVSRVVSLRSSGLSL